MKPRQNFPLILLLALITLTMACDQTTKKGGQNNDHKNDSIRTGGTVFPETHLVLEGHTLCLDQRGEPTCMDFRETMVILERKDDQLRLIQSGADLPPMQAEELPEGLGIWSEPGMDLKLEGDRLILESTDGRRYETRLVEGSKVGFATDGVGTIVVIDGLAGCFNLQEVIKQKCVLQAKDQPGYVTIKPNPIDRGMIIDGGNIGTILIVDTYRVADNYYHLLIPPMNPRTLENLPALRNDYIRQEPLQPAVPEEGLHTYLIGGDIIGDNEVDTCSVPCPATLVLCGKYVSAYNAQGQGRSCEFYAGKCEVKAYYLRGRIKLVRKRYCSNP